MQKRFFLFFLSQSSGLLATDEDINQIDLHTIHPPKSDEIRKIVKKLKNKKASTNIPAEESDD